MKVILTSSRRAFAFISGISLRPAVAFKATGVVDQWLDGIDCNATFKSTFREAAP